MIFFYGMWSKIEGAYPKATVILLNFYVFFISQTSDCGLICGI